MSSSPPPTPTQLAQFEIIARLGAGGMAEVFLAKKPGAEGTYKHLVVKRILPTYGSSRRFRSMFAEEAQLATRLNHPNVVQVYDFSDEGGDVGQLLAMEYVEGPDLGRLMNAAKQRGQRVPQWVGAWIIAEAAKGLHYAHEKKDERGVPLEIVHRDVSPQNILLSFDGTVKIADFGIASARLFEEERGVIKGKFGYMSPEQARGEKVDRRGDLYALGVILWELLTGRPLHGGLGGEALLDIVRSGIVEPPSTYVPDLPDELDAIVLKALAPRREERFATGRELGGAIARAILARQELIDAATLEACIAQLVVREQTSPGIAVLPPVDHHLAADQRTAAAAPRALGIADDLEASGPASRASGAPQPFALLPMPEETANLDGPREVRHVVVVALRLDGLHDSANLDAGKVQRILDRLKAMLGEIAFKRRMRWVWTSDTEARAIAGLETNPTRGAADATWLALDTHEAIHGVVEDAPLPLSAAVAIVRGIASGVRDPNGHLVRFHLHDPASFLAGRLVREVPAKRTYVAGGVYRLVRKEFRWGDAPSLQLDGAVPELPQAMRVYALERSLSRDERMNEASSAPSDLVGRDAERADLHAAYHEAVSGNGGSGAVICRVLIGEMGIGKTALLATFLGELPPNARVVRVEASPARIEIPYSGVADLVRDSIGVQGDEPFEEVADRIARAGGGTAQGDAQSPVVARLAELATNRLGTTNDDEDGPARKKVIVGGVRLLLAALALEQPVVVVLDSFQWGDRASVELMGEILATPPPLPILVILATRPEDRVMPLLQGLVRAELRGLSAEEQVRLVETRLGVREGAAQVCDELLPRVGGNPFFLLEMVDALLERGALEIREVEDETGGRYHVLLRSDRADADFQGLPSTLEQLLADRVHELPPPEKAIVDWLAVAGGPLLMADVRRLLKAPDDDEAVRLCARGLCDRKGDLLDFRHPLTRDVAYGALDGTRRVRMHRELGELLSRSSMARGITAAIVARHFARGETPEKAAAFYLEAAIAARGSYQTTLAVRYYQRALSCLPKSDPRRVQVHEALEAVFRMLGRKKERIRQLDALRVAAKEHGSPRSVALALLRTARFYQDDGQYARGLVVARDAAGVARGAGLSTLEVEAESVASEFLRELGDVQGALAACDRALAACDPAVNAAIPARTRADVLRARAVLLRRVGRVREAVDALVDAIAVFRREGALRLEARAKSSLAYSLFVQGRYEDAIALGLESIQLILSTGGRIQIANPLASVGHAYARLGDMDRALAYFKRARDAHERSGDHDGYADTLIVTAEVLIEMGELDRVEGYLDEAGAMAESSKNAYDLAHVAIARSCLARAAGDPREAIEQAVIARRAAETQALVSFHFYGLALEAASRADAGEHHTATLLATTALGTVETLQGCEYGLEVRVLCTHALLRAQSPQVGQVKQRAVDYAYALMNTIRDRRLRRLFAARPLVSNLFLTDETYCAIPMSRESRGASRRPSAPPPVPGSVLPGAVVPGSPAGGGIG